MPHCATCGAEVKQEHRFCLACGARMPSGDPGNTAHPLPQDPQRARGAFPWRKVAIVSIVVVLVALGVLVLLAATGTAKVPVLSAMFHTSTPGPTVSPSPTPIPSPAETVRIYMTAFSNLDIDRMQQLVCGRDAEEMRESMDILEEVVSFSDVTIDVSGLHYELIEEGQDTASVRVTGEMFTLILGEENVEEIDEVTHLVREDGTWKVCGEY